MPPVSQLEVQIDSPFSEVEVNEAMRSLNIGVPTPGTP